ncbi:MAG: AmpG family muropeptide MFS transporter [Endozoicomonadaceae bacterium]|nr:AmpG family muropeptide MFS transporter [Endozoicomonadaceae bacterium]
MRIRPSLTNVYYSASQYALFSSIMLIIPKFISGFSGLFVDHFGYVLFFIASGLIGFPVLWLIYIVDKQIKNNKTQSNIDSVFPQKNQST